MKDDTHQIVTEFISVFESIKIDFLQFIPGLVNGLVIFVVGILVAYFLRWICSSFFQSILRLLPKKITEKSIVQKNLVLFGTSLGKIVFLVVLVLTIATSLNKMGLDVASDWLQNFAKYLPNIIIALAIALIGWRLKEILSEVIFQNLNRASFKHSRLVSNFVSWAVFIVSIMVSLEQVGVNMSLIVMVSSILAGVVAGGIALTFAFGAKSTIADILCCYQLSRFMKVGQKVEVAGFSGVIDSVGPTFVLLDTEKGKVALSGRRLGREVTLILSEGDKS